MICLILILYQRSHLNVWIRVCWIQLVLISIWLKSYIIQLLVRVVSSAMVTVLHIDIVYLYWFLLIYLLSSVHLDIFLGRRFSTNDYSILNIFFTLRTNWTTVYQDLVIIQRYNNRITTPRNEITAIHKIKISKQKRIPKWASDDTID